ncbi:bifunctional proline dehydrogenase/L-glutamate gamma-semialdehyde dehydrogenase PutA [Tranquillimonas rosea]|uniref:bifunctional proline dehydrogenase/L-glutamate gamma-semialdehyde dehydrogenase PutA n=1 Tax=Tranquillimonas rosea TaxID=641238 RepID=UPI003BABCB37
MPRDSEYTPLPELSVEKYPDAGAVLAEMVRTANLSEEDRARISEAGAELVRRIRGSAKPGLMETFLSEYGLSTEEGIALMCLAEALLRVPDAETIDDLIEDKIAPSDWGKHMGHSSSPLVNASTWALMLTGKVLEERRPGLVGQLRGAVRRMGEPVIRQAVRQAMREMGRQFVLGENIKSAMERAEKQEARGYTYSYDMLGEAARTMRDADRYQKSYADAIDAIANAATKGDVATNPGISVKLSALHPRYEVSQADRVMEELVPRVQALASQAAKLNIGFNIDAEEADRLTMSLRVIEAALADPRLEGWHGFGVVVQAYGPRAGAVIDWVYDTATRLDRKLMVRLVKGAYWDTEIKAAQVAGTSAFPVFTAKPASDVSFIANARKLLGMTDRIYPQFATHNAHTVAAVLDMADDKKAFEFQRLHGMGETLHDMVMADHGTACRIYAPVGAHRDLLAYLVRRLLENGANSSFVNQIVDDDVPPEVVAADPFKETDRAAPVPPGTDIFLPDRKNSRGWDLTERHTLREIEEQRRPYMASDFRAAPVLATETPGGTDRKQHNPARKDEVVGTVTDADETQVEAALSAAAPWEAPASERAKVLRRIADLYEENYGEFFAALAREAGKSMNDAVGEVREAVDFLRYYASRAEELRTPPRGVFTCVSPWNFPLAIFTGQIAGALAGGNGVLAKPAEQSPLIAAIAVRLMHEGGVTRHALQFLPGDGATVGAALTSDPRVAGVAFTGSTHTARAIRRTMSDNLAPGAPLIAETGGLNAMIVDSTALLEQAVRDIVQSAFQSAGQRCSALRCLYVQEDVAEEFKEMLFGAMDELRVGDPWHLSTDVGPLIDGEAHGEISAYVEKARKEKRLMKEVGAPDDGHFQAPCVISIKGIEDLGEEVFGPVLHMATYKAEKIDAVIDSVNAKGYGLTFGLHSRIDNRVQHVIDRVKVGNLYVNRNQIGAIVGSQPFGGEGLSGTGPKAGGPDYVARFTEPGLPDLPTDVETETMPLKALQKALDQTKAPTAEIDTLELPGPTGESNRLSHFAREPILCCGPGRAAQEEQIRAVGALGGVGVAAGGVPEADALTKLRGLGGVVWWGDEDTARRLSRELAAREGPILRLTTEELTHPDVLLERHVCVDTTASGGNAALLAQASKA